MSFFLSVSCFIAGYALALAMPAFHIKLWDMVLDGKDWMTAAWRARKPQKPR